MSDYRQAIGTATTWRRAAQVTINNPLGGTGQITFLEEDVADVGGQVFRQGMAGAVSGVFTPGETFAMLDPTTGAATGEVMSHDTFYAILYSLYMDLATKRDQAQATPAP